jgi:hypothetical protein
MVTFASLLPGVREIRTPLLAGYVWLAAAWIALHSHFHARATPSSVRALVTGGSGQKLIAAGAVSFAALLLGIAAGGCYSVASHLIRRFQRPVDPVAGFLRWRPIQAAMSTGIGRLETGPTKTGLQTLNLLAVERVRAIEKTLRRGGHDLRELAFSLFLDDTEDDDRDARMADPVRHGLANVSLTNVREAIAAWTVIRILDERELLARRLVGNDPALFSEFDRLRSEAEFRVGITPPLLTLALVASFVWSWWIALALLVCPVLVNEGIRRADAAGDLLVDALVLDKVNAPAFERITRVADEIAESQGPQVARN